MSKESIIPALRLIEMASQKAVKYKITKRNTAEKKITVLMEEIGEICEAMQENDREQIVQEIADACVVLFIMQKHFAVSNDEIYRCFAKSISKLR